MVKKILLLLLSIFLIFQSYQLLGNIHRVQSELWIYAIINGWIINMYITGIFAFAGFALPTQKLLPESYYTVRNPKRLKKIYKTLGVDTFRKLLLATLWRNQKQREKYFNGKSDGISALEEHSKKSEFGHLIPFILLNIIGFYILKIGMIKLSICCLLLNFIGNLYPIILQRHHRMRIQVIKRRFRKK